MRKTTFQAELEALINRHSVENESNTPDFILAKFMSSSLDAFNQATRDRDDWFGGKRSILESERSEKWAEAVKEELVELGRCPNCLQGDLIVQGTPTKCDHIIYKKCNNCGHVVEKFNES